MGLDILWVILSLAGVLGLFFIMVYATKKLNSGIGYVNGNRMKVVDRISLGKDGMLVVVSVAGRLMLFGVTGQHIEKLAELDMTPEEYSERSSSPEPQTGMGFAAAFAEVIKGKTGAGKDKGDD
ncbi:MAG: flagellar biosynthetic protein FliO [Ruminiclostridium sp.]|nr:flagellar biosynthetic protein FliO [Ruminiclostridium sp.]